MTYHVVEVKFLRIIKNLRKSQGNMPQAKLASLLGVSRSTVSMWEIDKSEPDGEMVQTLADIFHVSIDYLYGRDEEQKKPAIESDDGLSNMDEFLLQWFKSLTPEEFEAARAYIQGRRDAQKE